MAHPRKPQSPPPAHVPYTMPSPYPDITPALVALLKPLVLSLVEDTLARFVAEGKIVAADPDRVWTEWEREMAAKIGLEPVPRWYSAPAPQAAPAATREPPRKAPRAVSRGGARNRG